MLDELHRELSLSRVDLAFAEQTKKGGVNGRAVKLEFRDDGYEPPNAEAAAKELTDAQPAAAGVTHCPETTLKSQDANPTPVSTTGLARGPNAVLALLGNVGTPTMVRAAPVAVETGTLYFGAFTGAVAGSAYAAMKGYTDNGKDIAQPLARLGKPDVLLVGAATGVVGWLLVSYVFGNDDMRGDRYNLSTNTYSAPLSFGIGHHALHHRDPRVPAMVLMVGLWFRRKDLSLRHGLYRLLRRRDWAHFRTQQPDFAPSTAEASAGPARPPETCAAARGRDSTGGA